MNLSIPQDMQVRIQHELATLPAVYGKVALTFTFNCTMSMVVGSMKVKREIETEMRA